MALTTMHTEEVALFNDPPYNTAEDKVTWTEYRPTFINQEGYSSINFHIAGNPSQYVDLSKTELYVRLKIEKEDGEWPSAQDKDAKTYQSGIPIDIILHTMWGSVDVSFNNIQVSSTGTNYMYKAAIECLLNYSDSTKKNQLNIIGMHPDSNGYDAYLPFSTPEEGINPGLNQRKLFFGEDGTSSAEFKGPLLADICNQDRLILNDVNIDITLWPNKNSFRLMGSVNCKLVIEEIYLDVCKVKVNEYCMAGHKAGLEHSKTKYPIQKTVIITKEISSGSFGETIENLFQGYVPARLIVGLVSSQAYAGDFKKNPLRFHHYDLESMGFYVNGEPTPRQPYRYNIQNNQYIDALLSLYKITGKNMQDTDNGISKKLWKDGLALTAFDVDPTTAIDLRYLGLPRKGHTRLVLKFKTALPETATVIMYGVFPGKVEIDDFRNVTLQGPKELEEQLRQASKRS